MSIADERLKIFTQGYFLMCTHANNKQSFLLETGLQSSWITGAKVMNNFYWCGERLLHQELLQDPNCNVKP